MIETVSVDTEISNNPAGEPAARQAEMPFAVVDGKPMTNMPRDLYIPPDALEVFLEAFEGCMKVLCWVN